MITTIRSLDDLIVEAAQALRKDPVRLLSRHRDWETHRARLLVWAVLHCDGYSRAAIAGTFRRDCTTVRFGERQWENQLRYDKRFRRDLSSLLEALHIEPSAEIRAHFRTLTIHHSHS